MSDGRDQMPEGVVVLLEPEMRVHRLHHEQDRSHRDDRQADDGSKRDVPAPVVGEKKSRGNAEYLAGGEAGLYETHDTAAQV